MKRCLHCGAILADGKGGRKFCSIQCRNKVRYAKEGEQLKARAIRDYYRNYDAYDRRRNSACGKYTRQWRRAAERGIPWEFTFETWIQWWGEDFSKRGNCANCLVMGRKGDAGPYSPNNTIKITQADNVRQGSRWK